MSAANSPRLLILADDLTGANDAGAQMAKRGIPAFVVAEYQGEEFPPGFEVVVINTESRHVLPMEAYRRVRVAAEKGIRNGVEFIYKKTDSTLRGNIGIELQALMEVTGAGFIPFIPAFPELGRTTRNGIHYVHRQPISGTEFARDPLNPIRENSVAAVLRTVSNLPAMSITSGAPPIPFAGFVIYDCESRDDLTRIGRELADQKLLSVLSGSAAFIEELPKLLEFRKQSFSPLKLREPVLLVNGSVHPRALQQMQAATSADFFKLQITPEMLFCPSLPELPKSFAGLASVSLRNCLLHSITNRDELADYERAAETYGIDPAEIHSRAAMRTGQWVRQLLERDFPTLVVFGGDTLLGIARACEWCGFIPRTEVGPGITVAQPLGDPRVVISKAGGFGDRNVLEEILHFVRAGSA